jgi:glutamyl-tRNA synthetase
VDDKILPPDFRPREWGADALPREEGDASTGGESSKDSLYREEVARLAIVLKVMGNRLKNLKDVAGKLAYFYKDTYSIDDEAVAEHLKGPEVSARLSALADRLDGLEPFDRSGIERVARDLAEELEIKAADLIHPSRVALTGQSVSPDIFSVIHLLGREKSTERLRMAAS